MTKTTTTTWLMAALLLMVAAVGRGSRVMDHHHESKREPQWSEWSDWGPCSRTCDGGATYQTRQCLDTTRGCSGKSIRYQICNMQPCPELVDFRLQQCTSYNSIPYQGKLHVWVPHTEPRSPCSLSCRSVNTSLTVQLSARVHDGTRCKPGSLDMCIDGICQPVGCDLQLNSDLKIDECGVCGGDGSTCRSQDSESGESDIKFRWEFGHQLSPCSASCDGGEQEVEMVCRDLVTGLVTDETLCDALERPPAKLVPCNVDPCPPKWAVGAWGPCSATCGGGVKQRHVHCHQGRNGTQVDDVICSALIGAKAKTHEPCNTHECPAWFEGPWSECSRSCGEGGIETRIVVCRDARGHVTNACRPQDQPASTRPCPSAPPCPSTTLAPITTTAPNRPPRQKVTPFSLFDDEDEIDYDDESAGTDESKAHEPDKESELKGILVQQHTRPGSFQPAALLSERLHVGEISLVPTDPTLALYYACGWFYKSFIVGEWTPCSVTCGDGARTREVHCKIFLEFSKTVAKLPDKECPGPKPAESEACFIRPCSHSKYDAGQQQHQISDQSNYARRKPAEDLRMATKMELTSSAHHSAAAAASVSVTKPFASPASGPASASATYVWKSSGFSQCSASCLGGVQESIIECVRESDGQRASPHHCPAERRPDAITRTCNDVPCPPRWNTSDFSACSRPCGGGVQTREVHCIHEVARGGSNTLPVSAELCPQPPPRAHQFCNMIDCPVEWKTGEWSQCSSTCDGGFKVRKVTCQQVLALGQVLTKTANQCNPTTRPAESKPCNSGIACGPARGSALDENDDDAAAPDAGGSTAEESDDSEKSILPDSDETSGASIINLINGDRPLVPDTELPKIHSSHQNFVQESANKKIVKLRIGGKATVYKGSQVSVRCPVKHYDKSKISWMKDHILLVKSDKHDVNRKGTLRIRDVTFSDSGVYSCIAGRSAANITLTVRPLPARTAALDSAESESESNRAIDELLPSHASNGTWTSKTSSPGKQQQQQQQHKGAKGQSRWPDSRDVDEEDELREAKETGSNSLTGPLPDETPTGPLFSDQEQDWYRQTPHYTYVTRARTSRPPVFLTQPTTPTTTATTPSDADDYAASTWPELIDPVPTFWPTSNWWGSIERNNERRNNNNNNININNNNNNNNNHRQYSNANQIPLDAHDSRGGSNAANKGGRTFGSAKSSSSRPVPYFQLLLAGLAQQAPEVRNDETTPTPTVIAHQRHAKAGGRRGKLRHAAHSKSSKSSKIKNRAPVHTNDPTEVVLGKGKAENLKFEWLVTPWSKCSQTCGGSGFQVRAVQCLVRLNNVTKSVESTLCEDAGLPDPDGRPPGTYTKQPATVQKCGLDTCPKWKTGTWTPCHQSRCFTWNTALQKRPIDCVMDNGTVLDPILCSEKDKPSQKRECFNENCRGTWKVSEWSHCTATCGKVGHQSRMLHCVWHGTDTPAGLACADLPRLPVARPCRGPPCPERGQCEDLSGYCGLAETLELCYIPRYRQHCCQTCHKKHHRSSVALQTTNNRTITTKTGSTATKNGPITKSNKKPKKVKKPKTKPARAVSAVKSSNSTASSIRTRPF